MILCDASERQGWVAQGKQQPAFDHFIVLKSPCKSPLHGGWALLSDG